MQQAGGDAKLSLMATKIRERKPPTLSMAPSPDKPKGLTVRIANPEPGDDRGTMVLNDEVVQIDEMFNRFINAPDEATSMLIIQSERDVLHEQIVQVMDIAKQAGIDKIGFAIVARD